MTITESCSCGATVTASDRFAPNVTSAIRAFREQHKNCLVQRAPMSGVTYVTPPPSPNQCEVIAAGRNTVRLPNPDNL